MDRKKLALVIVERLGVVQRRQTVLISGLRTSWYFDGKLLVLDPMGATLVSSWMAPKVLDTEPTAIGGPMTGADLLVPIIMGSSQAYRGMTGFLVRKSPKLHGLSKFIEGPLITGKKVVLVDDVISTGQTMLRAIGVVLEMDCKIDRIVTIMDRDDLGGSDKLRELGYDVYSLLKTEDVVELL